MALAQGRITKQRTGNRVSHPVAAAAVIHTGGLTCLDVSGNATPGAVATTLTAAGIAIAGVDNSGGAAGALNVEVERGIFQMDNHATDTINRTHIGGNAFIVDDQTVAATDGVATRSVAGKIIDVDALGVWVELG